MNETQPAQAITELTNPTPLLSSVISALSTDATPFTGERFVFGSGVEIFYEHYHRYVFAAGAIDSTQTVLDLGCGVGYGSLILASKAKKVISIDRDQDSVTLLKSLVKQYAVANIEALCGDVASLEHLITTPIDVVVCHELIEHLPQDLQASLIALIASGQPPFHKGTRLLISTPERGAYNRRNQDHNEFHEFEFSYEEFKHLLSRHFQHLSIYWQGGITGNVIVSENEPGGSPTAAYVQWQNPTKLLGTVSNSAEPRGVYMYGIASNSSQAPVMSSILIDQRELLFLEKLSIAANELNQTEARINRLQELNRSLTASHEFDQQAQQKIKDLLRENEILGARLEERIDHYESIIQAHVNSPLEVKLAKKCVEKLPNFIRKILRKTAAVGLAIVRG